MAYYDALAEEPRRELSLELHAPSVQVPCTHCEQNYPEPHMIVIVSQWEEVILPAHTTLYRARVEYVKYDWEIHGRQTVMSTTHIFSAGAVKELAEDPYGYARKLTEQIGPNLVTNQDRRNTEPLICPACRDLKKLKS
jgi:hypothetical protein